MKHSSRQSRANIGGVPFLGENLALGATGTRGVDMWYDEIKLTSGGRVSGFSGHRHTWCGHVVRRDQAYLRRQGEWLQQWHRALHPGCVERDVSSWLRCQWKAACVPVRRG